MDTLYIQQMHLAFLCVQVHVFSPVQSHSLPAKYAFDYTELFSLPDSLDLPSNSLFTGNTHIQMVTLPHHVNLAHLVQKSGKGI